MKAIVNPKQEIFCQLVAAGQMTIGKAYTQAGWTATGPAATAAASRALTKANIKARIAEIQAEMSKSSKLSREQLRDYLIEVLTTPAGEVHEKHRLCQSYKLTAEAAEYKMPDKLRAAEQLCKILGWHAPDEVKLSADDALSTLIASIRARGIQ
jgi:siderophore synthetase component